MAKKKIKVTARCASFDVEIEATVNARGLVADEVDMVTKNLKHRLQNTVAKLPFAHVYPYEVRVK
jgi:hypothetical protein